LTHVDVPEVEHRASQWAFGVVGPHAAGKHERRTGFTGQTKFAAERRTAPVEWSIRLRRDLFQFGFSREVLWGGAHLDEDLIGAAVATDFACRLRVGTQH